jgi:hypothetical protein
MKGINELQNRKINKLNTDAGFPIPVNLSNDLLMSAREIGCI